MLLQGVHFSGSNLTGANFRGADLYWNFFLANLTEADFEGAQMQGIRQRRPLFNKMEKMLLVLGEH